MAYSGSYIKPVSGMIMGHGASFRLPYGTGREFRRESREMECSHVVSTKDSLIAPVHERMPNVSPSPALPPTILVFFLVFLLQTFMPKSRRLWVPLGLS